MKRFKFFSAFLLAIIFSVAMTNTTFAGKQDFVLVNQTGRDIVNLYVTPTNSYNWNDDILLQKLFLTEAKKTDTGR